MNQILEELDKSMNSLCLSLMNYRKDDPRYNEILNTLAQQYQECSDLMSLGQDDMNNTYYFKYSNMGGIKSLLINAGYLEQMPKAKH